MDGPGSLLTRLRGVLAAFDDDALAGLANKGLVRRARKDLETIKPQVLEPVDAVERLRVQVADAVAELALLPAQSRCDCPASGICRHILAALIFVKESAAESGDAASDTHAGGVEPSATPIAASPVEEVLALDDEAIGKWAGKALVARVSKALALGLPVEFEAGDRVAARLPTRNVNCRWMPGCGPEGMICSCHEPRVCEHRVAVVLALQAARGTRVLDDSVSVGLMEAAGAPRSREDVLASVGSVVAEMVALGLSRLSRASAERLRTLAVSAHGVDLPRLERLLTGLAAEVELALARDAQADSANLLAQAARVEALRRGLDRRPTPHLVGQHKTSYEPVGDIELAGMGARAWRSPSGFAGLSVYFWDLSARNWATWTEARPLTTGGFDPIMRYQADGPWPGLASPAEAARKSLRLIGAWRNRQGRLSGRPATRAIPIGQADATSVPVRIEHWDALADRARRLFGGGFHDRTEQDTIVLLAPARWGPALFDEVRQELLRIVWDPENRPLVLALRHEKGTEGAVNTLLAHDASATWSVLGLLHLVSDRLSVEPITLHTENGPINLTLEGAASSPAAVPEPAGGVSVEQEEDADVGVEIEPSSTNLGRLLSLLAMRLLAIAEGGLAAYRAIPELHALGLRTEALGLACCGTAVGRVVAALEAQRRGELIDPTPAARNLLAAYHIVRLALVQESIAVATAGIVAAPQPDPMQAYS